MEYLTEALQKGDRGALDVFLAFQGDMAQKGELTTPRGLRSMTSEGRPRTYIFKMAADGKFNGHLELYPQLAHEHHLHSLFKFMYIYSFLLLLVCIFLQRIPI